MDSTIFPPSTADWPLDSQSTSVFNLRDDLFATAPVRIAERTRPPLQLHDPDPPCKYLQTAEKHIPNFANINESFQLATGWSLAYREWDWSQRWRRQHNSTDLPIHGRLVIDDMSALLPPGKSAANRQLCERFVDQLNELVAGFEQAQQRSWELKNELTKRTTLPALALDASTGMVDCSIRTPPALNLNNVAITPLANDPRQTAVQWQVDSANRLNVSVLMVEGNCPNASAALVAATTAVQCFASHEFAADEVLVRVNEVIFQMFLGDQRVTAMLVQLDPVTGDFCISGCGSLGCWQSRATGPIQHRLPDDSLGLDRDIVLPAMQGYLPGKEHLLMVTMGHDDSQLPSPNSAFEQTVRSFSRQNPDDCRELYHAHVEQCIPRVLPSPTAALLISRI